MGEFAWLREALSESPIFLRTRTGTAFAESLEGGAQSLIYIPHGGAFGQDSFDYTISDRFGQTSTATVTVNVTPLRSVELTVDTGEDDGSTNDPRITAVIDGVGSNSQVTFEVDRDFDGVADESALAMFTMDGLADASGDGMAAVTLNPLQSGLITLEREHEEGDSAEFSKTISALRDEIEDMLGMSWLQRR